MLGAIQADDLLDAQKGALVDLGLDQDLEHAEKRGGAVDGGGIEAFDGGPEVRALVGGDRAGLFDALPQNGLDGLRRLLEGFGNGDEAVHDLGEERGAARERLARLRFAALPDEVRQGNDDLVDHAPVELRFLLLRGRGAHVKLGDLGVQNPEAVLEKPVAVSILRREKPVADHRRLDTDALASPVEEDHFYRAEELVERVPASVPVLGDSLLELRSTSPGLGERSR